MTSDCKLAVGFLSAVALFASSFFLWMRRDSQAMIRLFIMKQPQGIVVPRNGSLIGQPVGTAIMSVRVEITLMVPVFGAQRSHGAGQVGAWVAGWLVG